ncbi:hypothetical protein KSP39_PZI022599 [Platanthera zijinensis]|uniref:Uncharacterized protein n=1 Tax=Platanthera zijinensis TaxID=2320716 RepID=A0AAP0AWY8_9ASPA
MAEIGTEPPEAAAHAAIRADRAVNPFVLAGREEILRETPRSHAESGENFLEKKPSEDRREVFRALEAVEKNTAAIAESYASLFSTLRLALSEVWFMIFPTFDFANIILIDPVVRSNVD